MRRSLSKRILGPLGGKILDLLERRQRARRTEQTIPLLAEYIHGFNSPRIYGHEEAQKFRARESRGAQT